MKAGQATDVALDPLSGPIDAVTNPTGNLQTIYAAFSRRLHLSQHQPGPTSSPP